MICGGDCTERARKLCRVPWELSRTEPNWITARATSRSINYISNWNNLELNMCDYRPINWECIKWKIKITIEHESGCLKSQPAIFVLPHRVPQSPMNRGRYPEKVPNKYCSFGLLAHSLFNDRHPVPKNQLFTPRNHNSIRTFWRINTLKRRHLPRCPSTVNFSEHFSRTEWTNTLQRLHYTEIGSALSRFMIFIIIIVATQSKQINNDL